VTALGWTLMRSSFLNTELHTKHITWALLASPFASKIKLNTKVTEINSEDGITIVKYVDKSGATKLIKTKTVLVTVSLGVLKAGTVNFVPSLPTYKQQNIDTTGFGLINKYIMTWDNDEDLVWPEDELYFLLVTPDDDTSGQCTTFSNPSKFKNIPTLIAWIGGDDRGRETDG